MPKTVKRYADKQKAQKYRNHQRSQNYARSDIFNTNSHQPFTQKECKMILKHDITDIELAALIGRSTRSIQIKRSRLKQNKTS